MVKAGMCASWFEIVPEVRPCSPRFIQAPREVGRCAGHSPGPGTPTATPNICATKSGLGAPHRRRPQRRGGSGPVSRTRLLPKPYQRSWADPCVHDTSSSSSAASRGRLTAASMLFSLTPLSRRWGPHRDTRLIATSGRWTSPTLRRDALSLAGGEVTHGDVTTMLAGATKVGDEWPFKMALIDRVGRWRYLLRLTLSADSLRPR